MSVPYYYGKTAEIVGPYLTLFWEKLYVFGLWLAELTKPVRDWLSIKIPILLEWVSVSGKTIDLFKYAITSIIINDLMLQVSSFLT